MMKYELITSDYHSELEDSVNNAIADGWRPVGGIAIAMYVDTNGLSSVYYAQAMVRDETADAD